MELIPHEIQITAEKIKKFTFPIYVPPNVKDDMVRDLFLFLDNQILKTTCTNILDV